MFRCISNEDGKILIQNKENVNRWTEFSPNSLNEAHASKHKENNNRRERHCSFHRKIS